MKLPTLLMEVFDHTIIVVFKVYPSYHTETLSNPCFYLLSKVDFYDMTFIPHLDNYLRLHVCLSFRMCIRLFVTLQDFKMYHKMSLVKVPWFVLGKKNMHFGSP